MSTPSATPTKCRGGKDPASAILSPRADGTIAALSSDGYSIYTVRLAPLSCTCKGFSSRGYCYHSAAALARFVPPCAWCDSREDVSVYWNEWDQSELALCAVCFPEPSACPEHKAGGCTCAEVA